MSLLMLKLDGEGQ